jgi:hypothetical protein
MKPKLTTIFTMVLLLSFLSTCTQAQDSLFTNAEGGGNPQLDNKIVELGVTFKASVPGNITHIRFFKTIKTDASIYTVNLWTANGQLLATRKLSLSGVNGWQRVALPTPVLIQSGVNYVASFNTIQGRYSERNDFFTTSRTRGSLTAPAGSATVPNGRFKFGTGFPDQAFLNTNYSVDVVFKPVVREPLVVQAHWGVEDTTFRLPIDSQYMKLKLPGIVTGNGATFKWIMEYVDYNVALDTIRKVITTTNVSPVVDSLWNNHYVFRLQATDIWGVSSESILSVLILTNLKQPVTTLYQDGKAVIVLCQDGTWYILGTAKPDYKPGGEVGKWIIRGAVNPGFEDEPIDGPENP